MNNYTLGIDVGVGSVGIAVVDNDRRCIEYLGSRIFDSSENKKEKHSKSQDRRAHRQGYRQTRRRHHRKERLKQLFSSQQITNIDKLNAWYKDSKAVYNKIQDLNLSDTYTTRDIYCLRAMALDYPLTGEELAAVLLHICNHRGYRPFYDDEEQKKDEKKLMAGRSLVVEIMERDGYRTVGEMYARADEFKNSNPQFKNYVFVKNADKKEKPKKDEYYLVTRDQTQNEVKMILDKQAEFQPVLNKEIEVISRGEQKKTTVKDRIFEIMFTQRDFEDGPSQDAGNRSQKYYGFGQDNSGYCTFYKNEKRGIRASLLGDLYATCNFLSQYTYVNKETGEIGITPQAAEELVSTFIQTGELTNKEMKEILKKHGLDTNKKTDTKETLPKCNKFTKDMKKLCESYGVDWMEWVGSDQLSVKSKIHQLAEVLAFNVTPKRRVKAVSELPFVPKEMHNAFNQKFGGTTLVSHKFMIESIEAFLRGEAYGDFQARKNKEAEKCENKEDLPIKLPKITDIDMIKNPVVYRSINETRKMVNAIIEKYGSPSAIHVEVASELNQSQEAAKRISKSQKENEKNNDTIRRIIAEKFDRTVNSVTNKELDRYRLYEEQEGKCMYSGQPIELMDIFSPKYEIDHIIPFSLIPDNTLNNKCLVLRTENQKKKQRTPLQYFKEEGLSEQELSYRTRVTAMAKKISKTKREYLFAKDIFQDELFEQWKSRNLNDTRYIAKYVTNMLKGIQIKNDGEVLPIKGGVTSRFRKWWLVYAKSNLDCYKLMESTLGKTIRERKRIDELEAKKELTVEENAELAKLTSSIESKFNDCAVDVEKEYGLPADYTLDMLKHNLLEKDRENNLHHGVDAAILATLDRKFVELAMDNYKLYQIWHDTPDRAKENYGEFVRHYDENKGKIPYFDDYLEKCVEKMQKYYYMKRNEAERWLLNPAKIPCRLDNFKDEILVRTYDRDEKNFYRLCEELYVESYGKSFVDTLLPPLVSAKPERKYRGEITDDKPVRKEENKDFYIKDNGTDVFGNKNQTVIPDKKYCCLEVYENEKGDSKLWGIRRTDIVKKGGKLYLRTPLPDDYAKHVAYLFKNDYIEIIDRNGNVKAEGYYQSSNNVNRAQIYIKNKNDSQSAVKGIASKDKVYKYYVDLLGRKGKEPICGERLLLTLPNECE